MAADFEGIDAAEADFDMIIENDSNQSSSRLLPLSENDRSLPLSCGESEDSIPDEDCY